MSDFSNEQRCDEPMHFAYADPPYLGCCRLYAHEHGTEGPCWDEPNTHAELIARLCFEYSDGWATAVDEQEKVAALQARIDAAYRTMVNEVDPLRPGDKVKDQCLAILRPLRALGVDPQT